MKHLFIINPAAGKYDHTEEYTQVIERTMAKHALDYEIAVTTAPKDAERIARAAAERGGELRIYACGGDGTLNGVVNGAVGFDNVAVTHFPGGSGNDMIKIFNETEPFHHLERLLDCEETRLDLIRCNDTYSVNIVSVGLDARVAAGQSRYKHLPLVTGHGAYTISLGVNILKGLSKPMTIGIDDVVRIDGEQTLVCICNGRCYGGGYYLVPEAEPDDGILDVLIVKKVALTEVSSMLKLYQFGNYAQAPEHILHYRCKKITVTTPKLSVVNVDGEIISTDCAEMSVQEKALRFFYPAGLTFRHE